jgi:hypothetical protein
MMSTERATITSQAPADEFELTDEDRVRGYIAWQLVGNWKLWVRRRVESISYETATSVRRRVSVDLRLLPELFGEPIGEWKDELIHYVPIAQLRKQRMVRFDLRDEEDRALPLITKHRNARIAAAMLSAAAKSVVANAVNKANLGFTINDASVIVIPAWLEYRFWRMADLNPQPSPSGKDGALAVFHEFNSNRSDEELSIGRWEWSLSGDRLEAEIDPRAWLALLGSDVAFVRLAYDVARLFMICVPLHYREGQRRIVKFSYTEYLNQPESPTFQRVKSLAVGLRLAKRWNRFEDWLEGLPSSHSSGTVEEWVPSLLADQPTQEPFRRKLFQALGWTTAIGRFETPAVGHGSSYHLTVSTPDGIQIRRAQLRVADRSNNTFPFTAQRGNRTLRAVDLHVSGVEQSYSGNVYLNIRPESSLIVRAGFCAAALTAVALTLLWLFAARIGEGGGRVEAVVAVLVVIPGLLTVLAARDSEHPLATRMVFGLRVLAMFPGVLAVLAAGQVVVGKPGSGFGILLFALAWGVTALLGWAWRLASRGRPDLRSL